MPRFAANISTMFTERPMIERMAAAQQAGFAAVEIQFPYEIAADDWTRAREEAGIEVVLINLPAGDWAGGERGIGALPGREDEFRDGLARGLDYAQWLGCRRINVLAGIPGEKSGEEAAATLAANLALAADAAAPAGIRILTEPVNTHDVPGFFLDGTEAGLAALDRAGHPNLALQYDVYHMVRMGRDAAAEIAAHRGRIGHIQFADVPGRHQPGTGHIDFAALFAAIDGAGYRGWCGAEYFPEGRTEDGLAWLPGDAA